MSDASPPVPAPTSRRHRGRRTWKQRLILVTGTSLALLLLASAGVVLYVRSWYSGLHRVKIVHAITAPGPGGQVIAPSDPTVGAASVPTDQPSPSTVDSTPSSAMNILMTGSDGRSCIDPKSPFAGAFLGDGTNIGSRSDTIMVLHIDPAAHQLGLLSFPRDLLVTIAGTNHKDKINAAFKAGDPNPLIQTIESNFGIRIDHYVGVDFCAFKSMVDAIGGISIPFQYPTRDLHTGLNVTNPGCHAMSGDEALAYVRSRYYEYEVNGKWISDGTSDYGRIARQQDFIRRVAVKAVAKGLTNPITALHLLGVAKSSDVQIDDGLSLTDMIHLGNSIRDLGANSTVSYRLDGHGEVLNGADVIVPDTTSPASKAILTFFRGAAAPAASSTSTTTSSVAAAAPATTPGASPTPSTAPSTAGPTNDLGIYPPADVTCP